MEIHSHSIRIKTPQKIDNSRSYITDKILNHLPQCNRHSIPRTLKLIGNLTIVEITTLITIRDLHMLEIHTIMVSQVFLNYSRKLRAIMDIGTILIKNNIQTLREIHIKTNTSV